MLPFEEVKRKPEPLTEGQVWGEAEPAEGATPPDIASELTTRGEKFSEQARIARNEGNNSAMDSADGAKRAYYEAARLVRAAAPTPVERQTCDCEASLDFKTLRDSLRSLSNEAAGVLGFGGEALRDLLGNTNCAVLESKINDARVVLKMTGPEGKG